MNTSLSSEFVLPKIHFFGRNLAEYCRIFLLRPERELLPGTQVLDAAGGPSSFTAEATRLGLRAVAADPHYGARPDALATLVRADHARVSAQMLAKPHLLSPSAESFPDLESAIAGRASAAAEFLADYETGFLHGRYIGASLPRLPFADASFDLTLCGHLLFLHAALLDQDFHLEACHELLRVTRPGGEVRLHPLCGGDGRGYAGLDRLLADLKKDGVANERIPVRGAFFHAADATLVLKRP